MRCRSGETRRTVRHPARLARPRTASASSTGHGGAERTAGRDRPPDKLRPAIRHPRPPRGDGLVSAPADPSRPMGPLAQVRNGVSTRAAQRRSPRSRSGSSATCGIPTSRAPPPSSNSAGSAAQPSSVLGRTAMRRCSPGRQDIHADDDAEPPSRAHACQSPRAPDVLPTRSFRLWSTIGDAVKSSCAPRHLASGIHMTNVIEAVGLTKWYGKRRGHRRRRPRGRGGRGVRLPGPQRRRQDHDDPAPARASCARPPAGPRVLGHDAGPTPPAAHVGVAFVSSDPGYLGELTAAEQLDYMASLRGLPRAPGGPSPSGWSWTRPSRSASCRAATARRSAWSRRSWATSRCWSWTSRRAASTR